MDISILASVCGFISFPRECPAIVHYVPSLIDAQDAGKTLFLNIYVKAFESIDWIKKIRPLSQIPGTLPKPLRIQEPYLNHWEFKGPT